MIALVLALSTQWTEISVDVLQKLKDGNAKIEWPGIT